MEIDRGSTSHDQITRKHGEDKEEEERGKLNPIVVLLVGAPGSGKSTFCDHVMKNCPRPWARICQDTISNGKSGTKIQCLASAGTALKDGKSVFIDRCNLEREQRAEFLKLGGPKVEKHAVVLDLPAKLCISRSVKRSGHEGNLQGGKAAAVVNRMLQKKELPKLSEGFTRITFCQDEVPLPPTSPLFTREGITHVIHVLGPNMNPHRPNCLNNDYAQGCEVLRESYSSLFEGFASIVRCHGGSSKGSSETSLESKISPTNGDQKVKRESIYESDVNKKFKGLQKDLKPSVRNYLNKKEDPDKEDGGGMTKAWNSWAQALYNIAMHPDKHKNVVMEILDDVVVLKDLYPKAQRHLLVLARGEGLDQLADVCREHLSLLKTMHAVGLKWAEKFLDENKSLVFRLGYHSAPSMRQLHLHVISQDFDSKHLKNKKHWNSFNTPFFRDSVDVIQEINEHGKATSKNEDNFLSMELRCHRCQSAHPNIPRLRSHISSCQAPFPAALLQNSRLVFMPSEEGTGK
ncbi:transcription factor bHLH140-like [Olea europaea var. sylvestris]|uniref:transcription factor bHLH140-like n=1 Tax=Olea europaea var. sylvestris TaxID=158386 RepID=UPI000C1CD166|nr:transcription factor bHLH140-like [Olea europaea var. sylvestris]